MTEPPRKRPLRDLLETLVVALLLALFIRAFFFQVFYIPSGSMEPTLNIGDRIIVNKLSMGIQNPFYGFHEEPYLIELGPLHVGNPLFRRYLPFFDIKYFWKYGHGPQRFHIMVFKYPKLTPDSPPKDYIKRVMGLPGERIAFQEGRVLINGEMISEVGLRIPDTFTHPPIQIPDGHYLMLGDNRPNSYDGRYWGPLPQDKFVGPAILRIWPLLRVGIIR